MDQPTFFTLRELGELFDRTKPRVRRLLRAAGVPLRRVGNKDLVFVRDLIRKAPALAASIQIVDEHRRALARIDALGRAIARPD
jgi:hypothetical protein